MIAEPKKPSYTLEFTSAAIRDLENLDLNIRRRVFSDIEKLKENPRPHGVEKMETKEKLFRVRVGPGRNYRAMYQIRDDVLLVLVVRVGHRKEVYRQVK